MKQALLILAIILYSVQLYSAEPLVKFYLQDGSTKQYNLSDIDSLNVIDKKNSYVLRIHYQDTLVAYYPTEIIGSIKFEKDSAKNDILNVYIFSYPKSYILSSIDSVIFYIDPYLPLTIGSQVWMLKNLNVDHYRNGDSIPEIRDIITWRSLKTGAWGYYFDSSDSGDIYGKLYNWYAINNSKGLAPTGWHVPSDIEWSVLCTFLGGDTFAGDALKESGNIHWSYQNSYATNKSGFSALPGGYRYSGGAYSLIGVSGGWWSSSANDNASSRLRGLSAFSSKLERGTSENATGQSVRCIKDK